MSAAFPNPAFWDGKRVLLTGSTGFKGSWAALWLSRMGAKVTGLALPPETDPALYVLADVGRDVRCITGDLSDYRFVADAVHAADPQIVIHMAAQALVRRSIMTPAETFATNVQGTVHLLAALRRCRSLEAILVITSDKVYANDELGRAFVETDRLGGKDPYSASKAAAEIVTQSFAKTYFEDAGIPVATARGGNIIGGGDFSMDRLVPDIFRAVCSGTRLALRHPESTRPWQHVLDCIAGYFLFVEALATNRIVSRTFNFGPRPSDQITVAGLADLIFDRLEKNPAWDYVPVEGSIEMKTLTLDASEAREKLGWRDALPRLDAVSWTAEWYLAFAEGRDMREVSLNQLSAYQGISRR